MRKLNKSISIILIIIMIISTFSVVSGVVAPTDCNYVCEHVCLEDEGYECEYICDYDCECVKEVVPDEPGDTNNIDITDTPEEPDKTECEICPSPECVCVVCELDCICAQCEPENAELIMALNGTQINPTPLNESTDTLTTGWWIVPVDQIIDRTDTITVTGNVNLILADGSHLTVHGSDSNAGINVSHGNTLTISTQGTGTGELTVVGGEFGAGIGGGANGNGGTITISGGIIHANGGVGGAGIGGGINGSGGLISISGGSVNASSGDIGPSIDGGVGGAGIGGGVGGDGGEITISGGEINVRGGNGAGIGGGKLGKGGKITISGGIVLATSYGDAANIGGGDGGDGGEITISGGEVEAITWGNIFGPSSGAGIGGGGNGNGGLITISGGTINASGGLYGAGIGGGVFGDAGIITISDGTIFASSSFYVDGSDIEIIGGSTGIGGGTYGSGGLISIEGGKVVARGGHGGAGIGGGKRYLDAHKDSGGNGGTIIISSGNVEAIAGNENSSAIGRGEDGENEDVTISGDFWNYWTSYTTTPPSTMTGSGEFNYNALNAHTFSYIKLLESTTPISVTGISLNKSSTTLTPRFTETLIATVTPNNATNKSVRWSTSNPAVAIVNNNGVVTGVSPGNAIITATTVDGGYRATCNIQVTPAPTLTLDRTFMLLQAGQTSTQLVASLSNNPGVVDNVGWSSGNNAVATVNSNGVVTAVAPGTAIIRATSGSLVAECRVDVIPAGSLADAINSIRLLQTSATINARSTSAVRIPIQLIFKQASQSASNQAFSISAFNQNASQSISAVRLQKDETGQNISVRLVDDRTVEISRGTSLNEQNNRITSLKTKLEFQFAGSTEWRETENELNIRIVRTNPTIRFASIRFNSFFPNNPVNVNATSNIGTVTDIRLTGIAVGDIQVNDNVRFDRVNRTLTLINGQGLRRLTFDVYVEGFAEPFTRDVSVSVRTTRPTARLSATTVTMKKQADLRINSNNDISAIQVISDNSDIYSVSSVRPDGTFRLTYKPGSTEEITTNARLRLRVTFAGVDAGSVELNLNIKAPGNTSARLSSTSVTLSTAIPQTGNRAIINLIPTPVDVDFEDGIFKWEYLGQGDRNAQKHIIINKLPHNNIEVLLTNTAVTGTYKAELREVREGVNRRILTLTVRVVDAAPNIRLSARGTFNIIDPYSTITITPRFTNYNWNGGEIKIKDEAKSVFMIIPGSETTTGAVTLGMKDVPEKPNTRQPVILTYNGIDTAVINITPRQIRPRLEFNNRVTLLGNDPHSEGIVNINIQNPATASILDKADSVKIFGVDDQLYSIRRVQEGTYAIGFKLDKDNQIDTRVRNGGNIRLDIDLKGSATPVRITVRVIVS